MPPIFFLSAEAEKAEYDLHENDPADSGYRFFLSRLFWPLMERLSPSSSGLDFGCGPGPTLSLMLQESGHEMVIYDPFYFPDQQVLQQQYDFVTATEVVEHFQDPSRTFPEMIQCLKPGGWMGLMTKISTGKAAFSSWHYKNDLTHVAFYSSETFDWIAEKWNLKLKIVGKDVILMQKTI